MALYHPKRLFWVVSAVTFLSAIIFRVLIADWRKRASLDTTQLAYVKDVQPRIPMACPGLLTHGQLLDDNIWKPQGCDLHNYTKAEAQECLRLRDNAGKRNWIVFVGDSRMRFLFKAFTRFIGTDDIQFGRNGKHSGDQGSSDNPPFLTEMRWRAYVDTEYWRNTFHHLLYPNQPKPSLIVASAGLWQMCRRDPGKFGTGRDPRDMEGTLEDYRVALRNWTVESEDLLAGNRSEGTVVVWQAIAPVDEGPMLERKECPVPVTNRNINLYNEAAARTLEEVSKKILFWTSGRELVVQTLERGKYPFTDALHLIDTLDHIQVQMLLNLYCNSVMHV